MICQHFVDNILITSQGLFILHTIKWFQVFLSNTNYFIYD